MLERLKKFKWGYVIIFLILAAIGTLCIVFPETLKIVCIVSGIILSLYAVVLFILTLVRRERQAGFAAKVIIAAIAFAAGIVMSIFNQKAVGVLTSLLGLYMVMDGSFKLQTTVMSKRYRVAAWWIMMVLAITVIAGGFVSLKWTPTEDNAAWTSRILGVTLIVDGIANLLTAFFTVAYEKKLVNEIKDSLAPAEDNTDTAGSDTDEESIAGSDTHAESTAKSDTGTADDAVIISIDGANDINTADEKEN